MTTTVESARHKFTVTTERSGSIDQGDELVTGGGGQTLCKTNSLPLSGSFPNFPQPFQDLQYNSHNSMDFEESHFYH